MNTNGMINLEVLLYFMIIIIIFSTLLALCTNELKVVKQTENRKEARLISLEITGLINNVYLQNDGFCISYTLPEKINEESYVIEINDSKVYVNSHYQLCVDESNVKNITYNGKNRKNIILLSGNTYFFEKNNNTVNIYQ